MHRFPVAAIVAASVLLVSACAGAQAVDTPVADTPVTDPPVTGMCAPEYPDCVDVIVVDPDDTLAEARSLLGLPESALGGHVRIARRGDEHFALTEDYVLDRLTVELDEDAEGIHRVTSVVVERFDGPARITAD
jgi:hypothetical protein